jgi:hypothetical protein
MIKYEDTILYDINDKNQKEQENRLVEENIKDKKDQYEITVKAEDKTGKPCEVCRVKYLAKV